MDWICTKLEDPNKPLLGLNLKYMKFWGIIRTGTSVRNSFFNVLHIYVIIFVITEDVDLWLVRNNLDLVLENLKINMLATVTVSKIIQFSLYQNRWLEIIEYITKSDLDQRQTDNKINMKIIINRTKYCRKITFWYCMLMWGTCLAAALKPIIKYSLSEMYRENVKTGREPYMPMVNAWVPFDKNTPIGYIVAYTIQFFGAALGSTWITSYDTNAFVTMVFFGTELKLLRSDSSKIFGTKEEPVCDEVAMERIKHCHRRHLELLKHTKLFDSCLTTIMLLYMFVCSIMLCSTAYQLDMETSISQKIFLVQYLLFGIAQLFIFCWHSNNVLYLSQDLWLGPYESLWTHKKRCRKELYILTQQMKQKIVFTAGPFATVNMTSFINILKGAYSYYTLLRNSN